MAGERIVLVETAARLSVDRGRIKVERPETPDRFVAPSEVAAVCLDHYGVQVTKHALASFADAGAAVIVTDGCHLPSAVMLPIQANGVSAGRIHRQIAFSQSPGPARLWQQIVAAKIRTQAATLRFFDSNGALRLERLSREVQPGDPNNVEAQAARHYWAHLFPDGFHREKQGTAEATNQRLNYGYAVLRALVARQIALAGLCPALGVGHKSSENPFNLADDLVEPYRFVVERKVKAEPATNGALSRDDRHSLLGIIEAEVRIRGRDWRLTSAIEETVDSFWRCLTSDSAGLSLPG